MPTHVRLQPFMRFLIFLCLSLAGTRALALCEHFMDPFKLDPIRRSFNRVERNLGVNILPYCDEAQGAYDLRKIGTDVVQKITQGSSDNYMRDMDYGITKPENKEQLRQALDPFVPGISADDAASRVARGRNNWIVWTAGNDRFWTFLFKTTLGGMDFIKTVSDYPYPRPSQKFPKAHPITRDNRWKELGLVNEPCFTKATGPRSDRWDLWLPKRVSGQGCPPIVTKKMPDGTVVQLADPLEDETLYPGVKTGSRGTTLTWTDAKTHQRKSRYMPVGSYYGYATGVIGLRLFPNPDFTSADAAKWDAQAYYESPAYFYDPSIKRPYRVGMACAFCHVGPNPSRPPADLNNPRWENLSSNPGAQYYWTDRIFDWDYQQNQDNFIVQLLHTYRPGTIDTSLVSSDMINNPRTMNAVYDLPARIKAAIMFNHREVLVGGEKLNKQFSSVTGASPDLKRIYDAQSGQVLSPRVLKDGSDSVGALGALNRVYINIGEYGEEWIQNFIPIIGGPKVTPFTIANAEANSVMWRATENQTPDVALLFLAGSRKDKLEEAPGGAEYAGLKDWNSPEVADGRRIFARNCAACHSSILPDKAYTFFNNPSDPLACVGRNYLNCWNKYWEYAKSEEFKTAMAAKIDELEAAGGHEKDKGFLKDNYLSTELRVPINLVDTDLCSAIATNALAGDIWDNFASSTYKQLPSVGKYTINYPTSSSMTNLTSDESYVVPPTSDNPRGGRGYFRPASLISLWATAPYFQNNTLGRFYWQGTTKARIDSFRDSIDRLLNPKKRGEPVWPGEQTVQYTTSFGDQLPGVMDVTTQASYLKIPKGFIPSKLLWTWIKDAVDREDQQTPDKGIKKDMLGKTAALEYDNPPIAAESLPKPKKKNFFGRLWASVFGGSHSTELSSQDEWGPGDSENGEFIRLGPIPKGTPVNLISNFNLDLIFTNPGKVKDATFALIRALAEVKRSGLDPNSKDALDKFMSIAAEPLLDVSRCKDFVVNRGHYFGTEFSPDKSENGGRGLSVDEKEHLIEFLKHL